MMAATLTKLKDYWMDGKHATPDDAKWRRFAQWVKISKKYHTKIKKSFITYLTVICVLSTIKTKQTSLYN